MAEHGVPVSRVINAGGIPQKNETLNRVYANVLNKPVLVPERDDQPRFGDFRVSRRGHVQNCGRSADSALSGVSRN